MAPEVILAMDEGQYDGKVDVWSLGITCIELAERKPPLFNMNAMAALYHIAQNDPPTLQSEEWTDVFRDFVWRCLKQIPQERPTSAELLSHHMVTRKRAANVVVELIARTKTAVRELDNLNYRKMKKILMVDSCETESTIGDAEDTNDEQTGGDSSKSNSITSEHSLQDLHYQSVSQRNMPSGAVAAAAAANASGGGGAGNRRISQQPGGGGLPTIPQHQNNNQSLYQNQMQLQQQMMHMSSGGGVNNNGSSSNNSYGLMALGAGGPVSTNGTGFGGGGGPLDVPIGFLGGSPGGSSHHSSSMMAAGDRSSMNAGGGASGGVPMYVNHHALQSTMMQQAMANAVQEHGANNFATIRTTSIVTKQQKEHMQEDMHEQMSGYKRMRREHQALLLKLEEKCKVEMEQHKGALDKEYDGLLTNFTRELERQEVKHQQELERRVKQNNGAEKKLSKEIALKQDNERKLFDMKKKKEYKANKERWKRELSLDESTPKRLRDATLQSQKDNLKKAEAQEEQRLLRVQKHYIELEMRKFKRRKMMMYHDLENQLLRDVSVDGGGLSMDLYCTIIQLVLYFTHTQELSKKQQQLEQAHEILLKHHEKTQELEYRQQKSVHNLREEQIIKQHASELQNQTDYSDRAEKELLRKHATELKQQPKSLKVRIGIERVGGKGELVMNVSIVLLAKRAADSETVPGNDKDAGAPVQGPQGADLADNTEGRAESCDKTIKRRQTKKVDVAR